MKIKRNMSTPESVAFWTQATRTGVRLSPLDAATEGVMRDMLLEFGLDESTVEKMILAMDPDRIVIRGAVIVVDAGYPINLDTIQHDIPRKRPRPSGGRKP